MRRAGHKHGSFVGAGNGNVSKPVVNTLTDTRLQWSSEVPTHGSFSEKMYTILDVDFTTGEGIFSSP